MGNSMNPTMRSTRITIPLLAVIGLLTLLGTRVHAAATSAAVHWQRWEHSLESSIAYANPYRDVTLSVMYTGPDGSVINGFGFWDGGGTFKIRCAFPAAGEWTWQTRCSDASNAGLHLQTGAVAVSPYTGANPLYRHGLLRISASRRYLTYHDGTPFLWMGDTAWVAPLKAAMADWRTYIDDRAAKHFTVVQCSPASSWSGVATDTDGNPPFLGAGLERWNPSYWQGFEAKVQYANEQGIYFFFNGLMEPVSRYPSEADARLFARNAVARLFGNFVVFSPSFDSPYMSLGDGVGEEVRAATAVHLITQHVGTSIDAAQSYYNQGYLDFSGCQSGHNNGDRAKCAAHAIQWNLALYSRAPHKPVINLEAYYDANGTTAGMAAKYLGTPRDARSLGYLSWTSGALGYTYGAHGIWNWQTDPAQAYHWSKAIDYPSSMQMRYLHDFFAGIEWWRLEPAHGLIRNQAAASTNQMTLARSAAGDLAVAYLPNASPIQIDMTSFPRPMRGHWFDPVRNLQLPIAEAIPAGGVQTLAPPAAGDWVLRLTEAKPRLMVLTDIGGDADDQQSMVRLLAHANEFEVEGLLATSRMGHGHDTMPQLITNSVQAYGQVISNLVMHASGWPTESYLRDRIRTGHGDPSVVGEGADTPASSRIIAAADADDPRPLWIVIWGGSRELAQALWRVQQDRSAADVAAFVSRLRVHAITDQDGHGAEIRAAFPALFWIDDGSGLAREHQVFRGQYQTGDSSLQNRDWINANIRAGHGPLGAQYPQDGDGVPGMKEGDTPSYLYVLPHGLNDPFHPDWGGWGGRFLFASNQVFVGAQDAIEGPGFGGANERYTVARWRPAFQRHFQARMDWCVEPPSQANHPPIAFVNDDGSRAILSLTVSTGAVVRLDAAGSWDPDGHDLSCSWFFYPDAGRTPDGIVISNASGSAASFAAPGTADVRPLHCILAVTDNGSPPLTAYRRVLVTVCATNGGGPDALIGHWKLDERAGATAVDATSYGVIGALVNSPVWTDGRYGGALDFDGVNDRVDLGNPAHLRLTGAMTLAAWVRIDSFSSNGRIVNKQGAGGSRGWSLNVESGRYASFQIARDASYLFYVTSTGALPMGQWIHLAGTYEPGVALRIYTNGILDRALTAGVPAVQYNSSLNVAIGDRPGGGTPFDGRIDDVRIYNRALNEAEVASLGPLRFSLFEALEDRITLNWTGAGWLKWAGSIRGPWNDITPPPVPPYTADIVSNESRFFLLQLPP